MNGRILSVFALLGSLATLVLVATFAGAKDVRPSSSVSPQAIRVGGPAWTCFRVRPALLLSEGALSERVISEGRPTRSVGEPALRPASRAIYRYVREQSGKGRIVLASYER